MLFKRRIDLVLTNNIALAKELTSIGLDISATKRYWAVKDFPDELYIATHLNTSMQTVLKLRQGLEQMKQSGHYQQVLHRWGL